MLMMRFTDVCLWAHNGHKFDHLYVCEQLNFAPTNIKTASYEFANHYMTFHDTFLWINLSIDSIAKSLGRKKPQPVDIVRCIFDVEICDWIVKWIDEHYIADLDIPGRGYDYASGAQAAYSSLNKHLPTNCIWIEDALYQLLSKCYYGGKVDSCVYGMEVKGKMEYLDLRSMYPSALTRNIPAGDLTFYNHEVPNKHSISWCLVAINSQHCWQRCFPLCPVWLEKKQLAFASDGRWRGWYTEVDIANMRKLGATVLVMGSYVFSDTCNVGSFFLKRYAERKLYKKGHPLNTAKKLASNSCYGYYALKWRREGIQYDVLSWYCLSHSRSLLVEMFLKLKCIIFYGDTDSVIVPKFKKQRIPESWFCDELSTMNSCNLDREYEPSHLLVLGKKSYAMQYMNKDEVQVEVKAKGIPKKCNVTYEDMKNVLVGNDIQVTYDTICHKNYADEIKIGQFTAVTRNLTVNVPYYKYRCGLCNLYHSIAIVD